MGVHFVYRSHYGGPDCKDIAYFGDDTVLDWFRRNWSCADIDALLGFGVYGFGTLFENAPGEPPADYDALAAAMQEHLYSEGPILCEPHLVTVQTDDDELQVAYYVFDDHFAKLYPQRVAYLLHEGWRLPASAADGPFRTKEPTNAAKPAGTGEGVTYYASEVFLDSGNLEDLGKATRIVGVRLPELARYLMRPKPPKSWPDDLVLLRAQLLADGETAEPIEGQFREALLDDPDDDATWAAYSDWLADRGRPPAGTCALERALRGLSRVNVHNGPEGLWKAARGKTVREARAALARGLESAGAPPRHAPDPAKSCVQVDGHLAQLCHHVATWGDTDLYMRHLFFDDRWAAANPDLANSILRYTRCWDALSPGGPSDD